MPATSNSVQFRNPVDVMNAYIKRGVPAFGIFCGKQFCHNYRGNDIEAGAAELKAYLDMLIRGEAAAIYTVTVYEDWDPKNRIKPSTEPDGSFNFRFRDDISYGVSGGYQTPATMALLEELKNLRADISEMKEEHDELLEEIENSKKRLPPPSSPTLNGILQSVLEKHLPTLADGIVESVFGKVGKPVTVGSGAAFGSEAERLERAIATLRQSTPDIVALLEKFALLSKDNPLVYNMAIGKLKAL